MRNRSLEFEEDNLLKTIDIINMLLDEYGENNENLKSNILELNRYGWENKQQIDKLERLAVENDVELKRNRLGSTVRKIELLKLQKDSPYFARIDFKDANENLVYNIYIGLGSVEKNFDFYVFDWRAPISSMFYDYGLGHASYVCPDGEIKGDILLKRQYKIRNGKIIEIYDSDNKIDDEILLDILNNNTSKHMKNIVATIQKEQNEIIRNNQSKVLLVQGVAGSGKTSVALHRAAYLLFNKRNEITSSNIFIFSPNEIFSEYISEVLPEMGETNIKNIVFEEYGIKHITETTSSYLSMMKNYEFETYRDFQENIFNNNLSDKRKKSIELKANIDIISYLDQFYNYLLKTLPEFKDISYTIGSIKESEKIIPKEKIESIFLEKFKNVPFINRIDLVEKDIVSSMEIPLEFRGNMNEREVKEHISKCEKQINNQLKSIFKNLDMGYIYKLFYEYCMDRSSVMSIDVVALEYTLDCLYNKSLLYEDIAILLYLKVLLTGHKESEVKHLIIDEYQDYAPIFYNIIKKVYLNSKITILGDLNQNIYKERNNNIRKHVLETFKDEKVSYKQLNKSYRSTKQITTLAKSILQNEGTIEVVDRNGDLPKVFLGNSEIDNIKEIINILKEEEGNIAIIAKNLGECELLWDKLKMDKVILVKDDSVEIGKTKTIIIPAYLSKGLEFDYVIASSVTENNYSDNDRNLLYTIFTRALHKLYIICPDGIPNILNNGTQFFEVKNNKSY